MQCDEYGTCSAAISREDDVRLFDADCKTAGINGIQAVIPLLATLCCPRCRGPAWHFILHEAPYRILCARCGSALDCELES
jgi:hypothetical protein